MSKLRIVYTVIAENKDYNCSDYYYEVNSIEEAKEIFWVLDTFIEWGLEMTSNGRSLIHNHYGILDLEEWDEDSERWQKWYNRDGKDFEQYIFG